jgi:hypothetical protein
MADDPNNTKAAFDRNWVSATEVGEHQTQINCGAWILAPIIIREALLGGCQAVLEVNQGGQKYAWPPAGFWSPRDRLRWANALNPSMRREDFPDRPWPWELRACLFSREPIEGLPLDRQQVSMVRVFLHRAEAVEWGLLPALESPQAMAGEESPSPDTQLNDSAVGIQTSAHAQSAPEQPDTEGRPEPAEITEIGAEDTAAVEKSAPAAVAHQKAAIKPAPAEVQLPRRSRKRRNQGGGQQTLRARVVLRRMYGAEYPTKEEVSNDDLLDRFDKEYARVEGKANPPSRHGKPSPDTVLREAGRR